MFGLGTRVTFGLRSLTCRARSLVPFHGTLIRSVIHGIGRLGGRGFTIHRRLGCIRLCSGPSGCGTLACRSALLVKSRLTPLVAPSRSSPGTVHFSTLVCNVRLTCLTNGACTHTHGSLCGGISTVTDITGVPRVVIRSRLVSGVLRASCISGTKVGRFRRVHRDLQGLVGCVPCSNTVCGAGFSSRVLSVR